MIKVFRLASFITATAALGFLALAVVYGFSNDAQKEKFLADPGPVDTFKKNAVKRGPGTDAPLIKMAQALSTRWNPPAPVQAVLASRPVIVPKFKLIGTCFYEQNPGRSSALVDDPGKGWRWVCKSDKIGDAEVIEISNGKIRYKSGSKIEEMIAEKSGQDPIVVKVKSATAAPAVADAQPADTPVVSAVDPQENQPELVAQADVDPEARKKQALENVEFVKKVMADLKDPEKMGMTPEEAAELGELGDFLKTVESEAAAVETNSPAPQDNTAEKAEKPAVVEPVKASNNQNDVKNSPSRRAEIEKARQARRARKNS
jgi:hypothetical protein